MSAALIHRLGHRLSGKRARRRVNFVLSAVFAALIAIVPVAIASGEQVLELPQSTAPAAFADTSRNSASSSARPRNQTNAPMPAGLGSIADYENQDSDDAPRSAMMTSPTGTRIDHSGSSASIENEALLGALVLGVIALEVTSSHHH